MVDIGAACPFRVNGMCDGCSGGIDPCGYCEPHRPTHTLLDVFELQRLLWEVRRDAGLAQRYLHDADEVLDEYGIQEPERTAMRAFDVKTLFELGVNPYLLYFCAIQLGVERADYYAQLRGDSR